MKKRTCCFTIGIVLSLLFFYPHSSAVAQGQYPTRPIELIIPATPGAPADLIGRYFSEKWSEFLGQPIIPINKEAGAMTVAAKYTATAKPDGYTIFIGSDTPLLAARLLRKDMGYNLDSFRIFYQFGNFAFYMTAKAGSRWKDMNDFLSEAKRYPEKLMYGVVKGSSHNYMFEILAQTAGVKLTCVPFKSSPDCFTAVLGGHVDLAVTPGLMGMDAQLIQPLAVSEEKRLYFRPNIPTLKELGYPIFFNSANVICGPKGIPDSVANKLIDAHKKTVAKYEKEIKDRMAKVDFNPSYLDGESATAELKRRETKYGEIADMMRQRLE